MWIKIDELGEGQHPSEVVVGIKTWDDTIERLIVDRRSIDHSAIEVGFPVGGDENRLLVELPRESIRGQWRIWMKRTDVLEGVPA